MQSGRPVETARLLLFLCLLQGKCFWVSKGNPAHFPASRRESSGERQANHWWGSNSKQKGGRAKWSSLEGKPRWTPGGRAEHSHSASGVKKLRASTHSKIMMNFSEITQIVVHKFIIPASLKVTAGVLVSLLSLTLLLFRELNAVQVLGLWRKPFLPRSCSSCVPGLPQRGLGLGFCSLEQATLSLLS